MPGQGPRTRDEQERYEEGLQDRVNQWIEQNQPEGLEEAPAVQEAPNTPDEWIRQDYSRNLYNMDLQNSNQIQVERETYLSLLRLRQRMRGSIHMSQIVRNLVAFGTLFFRERLRQYDQINEDLLDISEIENASAENIFLNLKFVPPTDVHTKVQTRFPVGLPQAVERHIEMKLIGVSQNAIYRMCIRYALSQCNTLRRVDRERHAAHIRTVVQHIHDTHETVRYLKRAFAVELEALDRERQQEEERAGRAVLGIRGGTIGRRG
jgi:hypothetical protein